MHIESRLFEFVATFFIVVGAIYAILTSAFSDEGGVEWAGTTALLFTGGMALIVATFFRFVARRLDTRPEDYEAAEVSDGAGELGFFAPHSWWPIVLAFSGAVVGVAMALWLPWLITAGVLLVIASTGGLVFEYYTGPAKH